MSDAAGTSVITIDEHAMNIGWSVAGMPLC
jgi:hypothetical protein